MRCGLDRGKSMIIIGEKLNGAIPAVAEAIARRDGEWIKDMARKEAEAGADFIDLCAPVEAGELEILHWMIELVQSVTDVPISIDSPSTEILAKACQYCKSPGLFNSVSMESKRQIDRILQLMQKHPGWEVIAMLCDDRGIPRCAAERLQVFKNIVKKADDYGIEQSRIHIDTVTQAAALLDPECEDGPGVAAVTKVIKTIRARCPRIHITSAISNISYGLPARRYMNYSFAALALFHGLDSAILDPLDAGMLAVISASEKLLALPETKRKEIAEAARDKRLAEMELPLPEGKLTPGEAEKYAKLAATILSMKVLNTDAKTMAPDRNDGARTGIIYGTAALLGLDEYCMEYIRAYKAGWFSNTIA